MCISRSLPVKKHHINLLAAVGEFTKATNAFTLLFTSTVVTTHQKRYIDRYKTGHKTYSHCVTVSVLECVLVRQSESELKLS